MKRIVCLLVLCLFAGLAFCPVAFAFPNEHKVWQNWRDLQTRQPQRGQGLHPGPHGWRVQQHSGPVTGWYGNHHFSNVRAYYGANRQQAMRIAYECQGGYQVIESLRHQHGMYTYQRRYHNAGRDWFAYYWIGRDTIIKAIVDGNGHVRISAWQRGEMERHSVGIGHVSWGTVNYFNGYADSIPEAIAAQYIAEVLLDD